LVSRKFPPVLPKHSAYLSGRLAKTIRIESDASENTLSQFSSLSPGVVQLQNKVAANLGDLIDGWWHLTILIHTSRLTWETGAAAVRETWLANPLPPGVRYLWVMEEQLNEEPTIIVTNRYADLSYAPTFLPSRRLCVLTNDAICLLEPIWV
jgi:hypothetical protein